MNKENKNKIKEIVWKLHPARVEIEKLHGRTGFAAYFNQVNPENKFLTMAEDYIVSAQKEICNSVKYNYEDLAKITKDHKRIDLSSVYKLIRSAIYDLDLADDLTYDEEIKIDRSVIFLHRTIYCLDRHAATTQFNVAMSQICKRKD